MKRLYAGIDIVRLFFACMIPLLHIPFGDLVVITFLRQYVSRLGVPYFFAVSGFFLKQSMDCKGRYCAMAVYEKRVGRLLLTWLAIYSPILIASYSDMLLLLKEILFLTPAYLWYLTALLVAGIPFCLATNRKMLWLVSAGLYLFGTLAGESYSWLTGGAPKFYTSIFLTTRNGVFFGLPMMCVGEISYSALQHSLKKELCLLVGASMALFAEITFVSYHVYATADRSMYLLLPLFSYSLIQVAKQIQLAYNTTLIRKASVAIYVLQFGIIYANRKIYGYTGLSLNLWGVVTLASVIFGGGGLLQPNLQKETD